jgi:DNA-directed RNA polymerase sigma subunit (sigma70/sigma32)
MDLNALDERVKQAGLPTIWLLSVRSLNALAWALGTEPHRDNISLEAFLADTESIVPKFKNIGKKSTAEIIAWRCGKPLSLETATITQRHRTVVDLREQGHTWKGIGDTLGVSTERARQIHARASRLLRQQEQINTLQAQHIVV